MSRTRRQRGLNPRGQKADGRLTDREIQMLYAINVRHAFREKYGDEMADRIAALDNVTNPPTLPP